MKNLLQDKHGKILIVEPSSAIRLEIQSALRLAGFREFEMVNNITDAKKFLRISSVDWIITQVFKKETENVCHLLRLLYDGDNTKKRPFVTMLVNSEEIDFIPKAFELGLMSFQYRQIIRDVLVSEADRLVSIGQECNFEPEFVAGTYLRQFLSEKKMFDDWSVLEQGLLKFKPTEVKTLLRLAEVCLNRRQYREGISYLTQALVIDPATQSEVERLKRTFNTPEFEYEFKKLTSAFDVNRCVVIDPDEAVHLALTPILKQLNIPKVETYLDGEQAWNSVEMQGEPDLLICEWKIPKVSGPAFIQRMRARGHHKAPVMLLSSLIRESDAILVSELGIAKITSKPVDVKQFVAALNQTLQQDKKPTDAPAIERKILKLINLSQTAAARSLLETYKAESGVSESRHRYLTAELLYAEGKYDAAKDEVIKSLRLADRDSLSSTNLLGKCLMRMGDFQAALQFMQKAQTISPSNIDRMCAIAELQIATNHFDLAEKTIDEAKRIDARNPQIAATELNLALMKNDNEKAERLLPQLSSPTQVITFMNIQAVSRIRSNQIAEGIEIYKRTIGLLKGPAYNQIKARLHYNLGLAYARQDVYEKAQKELIVATTLGGAPLKKKAQSLSKRVQDAINTKTKVKLLQSDSQNGNRDEDFDAEFLNGNRPTIAAKVLKEVEKKQNGTCLQGIFRIHMS